MINFSVYFSIDSINTIILKIILNKINNLIIYYKISEKN